MGRAGGRLLLTHDVTTMTAVAYERVREGEDGGLDFVAGHVSASG